MTQRFTWWVTLAEERGTVPDELRQYYAHSFSQHYYPAPYRMYSGGEELKSEVADRDCHLILGDSTVASTDLCEKIEERTRAAGRSARFLNLGVIAANTGISLARIVHELIDLRPPSITVLGGGGDILMPMSFDPRPGYPHIQLVYQLLFEQRFDADKKSVWATETQSISAELEDVFFERLVSLREQSRYGTPEWEAQIVNMLAHNVGKMARICLAWDIPFLFVLQPAAPFKAVPTRSERNILPPPESQAYISRQFEAAASRIAELSVWSSRAEYLDLHALFVHDTRNIFRDAVHVREPGTDQVAGEIAACLEKAGWLA